MNNTAYAILDLGCGTKRRPGTIGVDFSDRYNPDVVHDLNIFPYPFPDNFADKVYLDNVLEHLDSPLRVMEEVYRITKPGGEVTVIVPYFRSPWAFIDPTHKTFYTVDSFSYYDPAHDICKRYDYTSARFAVVKKVFNEELKNTLFKRLLVKFANRYPNRYENHLSSLFALDDLSFHLRKI